MTMSALDVNVVKISWRQNDAFDVAQVTTSRLQIQPAAARPPPSVEIGRWYL